MTCFERCGVLWNFKPYLELKKKWSAEFGEDVIDFSKKFI